MQRLVNESNRYRNKTFKVGYDLNLFLYRLGIKSSTKHKELNHKTIKNFVNKRVNKL